MTVSSRNTFLTGAGALALITLGSFAYASGGMSGGGVMTPGGGIVVPGANIGSHNTSYGGGRQSDPCCGKGPVGHGVTVPA